MLTAGRFQLPQCESVLVGNSTGLAVDLF